MRMKEELAALHFEGIDKKELHFISFKQDKGFELVQSQGLKRLEFLNKPAMQEIIVLQNQIFNQSNLQSSFRIQLL